MSLKTVGTDDSEKGGCVEEKGWIEGNGGLDAGADLRDAILSRFLASAYAKRKTDLKRGN